MLKALIATIMLLVNPSTGDNSDVMLKVFIIAGALCVLAIVALLVLPKLSKKKEDDEQAEIEEIDQE